MRLFVLLLLFEVVQAGILNSLRNHWSRLTGKVCHEGVNCVCDDKKCQDAFGVQHKCLYPQCDKYDVAQCFLVCDKGHINGTTTLIPTDLTTTVIPTTRPSTVTTAEPTTELPSTDQSTEPPTTEPPSTESSEPVPSSEPPSSEPPTSEEPSTEPPTSAEPSSEPPSSEHPSSEVPSSEPPSSEPPTSEEPSTEPPTSEEPSSQPPSSEHPASEGPSSEPPSSEPPTSEEPSSQPPSSEHPASEGPSSEPPSSEPPTSEEPSTEPPTSEEPSTEHPSSGHPSTEVPSEFPSTASSTSVPSSSEPVPTQTSPIPVTVLPNQLECLYSETGHPCNQTVCHDFCAQKHYDSCYYSGCNGFSCVSTCVRFTRAGKTYHVYHGAESVGEKSFAQITAIYDALNKTGIHHDKNETILASEHTKRPQGSGRAVEGGLGILNLKKQDQEESYAAKKKSGESAINLSDVLSKASKNKEKEKDQYIYEEVQDVVTEIVPFKVVTRYV